jgi:hypothetical protein
MPNAYSDQVRAGVIHGWHVYVLSEEGDSYSKIGSALSVKYRVDGLRNGNPRILAVIQQWHFTSRAGARAVEARALALGDEYRLKNRDWLRLSARDSVHLVELAMAELGVKTE